MTITKISSLNPRVWGVTIQFKVVEQKETRSVNFKDGTEHKVGEFLVGDDSATILLTVWDDQINELSVGKNYELTEARLTVFNKQMKLTTSRKSEIKEVSEEVEVNNENPMSEKEFEQPKKFTYNRNNQQKLF